MSDTAFLQRQHATDQTPDAPDIGRMAEPEAADVAAPQPLAAPVFAGGLAVGAADDPAEAAADRMAAVALNRLAAVPHTSGPASARPHAAAAGAGIARSMDGASYQGNTPGTGGLHQVGAAGGETDSATTGLIAASSGTPLASEPLRRMEHAFGRSFAGVRVHTGASAEQASEALQARAFTRGSDVYFARGQFAPGTAEGDHVLAHELAHVAAGHAGPTRRLFGFFEKSDPAKELEKKKAKEEKDKQKKEEADRKAQEAKDKAEAKAREKQEAADAKARAKTSKQNFKAEKTRLGEERRIGTAQREETKNAILADQQGGAVTSDKANKLRELFEETLAAEKRRFDALVDIKGAEAARDIAYRETWLENKDPELRAVRPPRETAAERLVAGVASMRTSGTVRQNVIDNNQRGEMLSKSVEMLYEAYAAEVDRLMAPPTSLDLTAAETQATQTVWDIPSNAATKKKRPAVGSAVDLEAIKAARQRMHLNPNPPQKPQGLDKAMGTADTAGGYLDKAGTALKIPELSLKQAGSAETKELQKGLTEPDGSTGGIEEKLPGGVGGLVKSARQASFRVDHGQKDDSPEKVLPTSVETQASQGIAQTFGILQDLLGGAQAMMRFASCVQTAHTDRTPSNVMKATKAAADALSVVAATGRDAANLAKFINPGITNSVASVVPGFNIFISVMSILSNSMTMGQQAIHVHQTDEALFAARSAEVSGSTPDVMVYPLLRVLQTYTKSLEQSVWSTAISIADLATSIATVASGGGYGIPAAVQAGVKVVDVLHSVGHFIADQVLVAITKKAQKDSIGKLEGAAENSLQKDPTMAVDGIIFTAVKGDKAAEMFLANYRLDGKPIDRTVLDKLKPDPANVGDEHTFFKVRSAVMADMGEDEDPQYFYQKWFSKAGALFASVKGATVDKWNTVGKLASDRNELEAGTPGAEKRGAAWRMKMMFKGGTKLNRSVKKTGVERDAAGLTPAQTGPTVEDNSAMGYDLYGEFRKTVEVTCGPARLGFNATAQQKQVFASIVDSQPDNALLAASQDPNNSDEWQEFFRQVLADRALASASA